MRHQKSTFRRSTMLAHLIKKNWTRGGPFGITSDPGTKKEKKRNEDQEAEMHEKPKKQTMQGDNLWPRVAEPWDAVQDLAKGIFAP